MRLSCITREGTGHDDEQHQQCDAGVQPVALEHKTNGRKDDADHRRTDEQYDATLYDSAPTAGEDAMPYTRGAMYKTRNAVEGGVMHLLGTVAVQVNAAANKYHQHGYDHAHAQYPANDLLYIGIVYGIFSCHGELYFMVKAIVDHLYGQKSNDDGKYPAQPLR